MTRFLAPLLFGVLGTALLVALGLWQLARLEWKEAMLAEIEARIAEPAGPLPERADPARDRFLPVRIEGRFDTGELHVLVSQKGTGAGYRIIAPFETAAGRRVMVDRGIVPVPEKDAPRAPGAATVTGNLHWPDEVDRWTPEPDPDAGIWFARDVSRMAEALGAEPVLVIARDVSLPGAAPLPVSTEGIPNDHLEYAVTWFGLAAVWLGMTLWLLWRIRRRTL